MGVISNGSMIEIVAPQILKNSALGLCGDMNGEFTADLTTPRMCVMRPRLAALSFMLPSGSCSGIPAPLKKEFEHESMGCARQTIVPTPVDKLYERISVLNHPTGMTHVVEKQSGKLYISKQMVRLVSPSQSPSSRGLLSLSPSHGHLSRPAPWRGVPFPVWLFTRSSLPSQLSSVRSSSSQSPAGLRLLPSLFKLYF